MAKKWLDSIEKQKRTSNVCDRQTGGHTDRVNDKKLTDSWARRGDQQMKCAASTVT